ncbi:hypothetical protein D3C75_1240390 [compost metagenome]
MLSQREGQCELFAHQPLMQIFHLFFRRCRLTAHDQAWAFDFNIQFALFEAGQRQRNAVVVIVAFLDVVWREPLRLLATH